MNKFSTFNDDEIFRRQQYEILKFINIVNGVIIIFTKISIYFSINSISIKSNI